MGTRSYSRGRVFLAPEHPDAVQREPENVRRARQASPANDQAHGLCGALIGEAGHRSRDVAAVHQRDHAALLRGHEEPHRADETRVGAPVHSVSEVVQRSPGKVALRVVSKRSQFEVVSRDHLRRSLVCVPS